MRNKISNKLIVLAVLAGMIFTCFILSDRVSAESSSIEEQKEIDKYVLSKMDELRIKGAAIGIVRGNNLVCTKGYGIKNNKGDAVTAETPFILGSTTKSITALAVMQLADEGKVKLDEPVQKYIPEFHLADISASSKITVRQLLNQTSGIPGTAGNSDYLNATSTPEDFLNRLKNLNITGAGGKEFQYSEANYVILGVLVARVSGLSYEEYIERNVYKPLDMKHSYTSKEEAVKDGLSTGYRTCFGFPFSSDFPYPKQYVSASYLISSAKDMAQYLKMYINNGIYDNRRILSIKGTVELFKKGPKLLHPEGYSYSMGWFVNDEYKLHDGRPTNYYSCMVIDEKNKTGVVILTNTNNRLVTAEYSMAIATGISNIISGKKVEPVAFGFRKIYMMFNIIVLVLVAALLMRFILSLTGFRKKLGKLTKSSLWKVIRLVLLDILLSILFSGTLIYLLVSMQISFSIAMLGQPDIVIAFITVIALSVVNLLVRLLLVYLSVRRNAEPLNILTTNSSR